MEVISSFAEWEALFKENEKRPEVRKWCEKDIRIKLENLKKILGDYLVNREIMLQGQYTDNECDKLNLAYYSLKNKFSKIHRWKYGLIRNVNYEIKKRRPFNWELDDLDYWTITPAYSWTYNYKY
jgi:hypothetical protein